MAQLNHDIEKKEKWPYKAHGAEEEGGDWSQTKITGADREGKDGCKVEV